MRSGTQGRAPGPRLIRRAVTVMMVLAALLGPVVVASPAYAHAVVVSSVPSDGADLSAAPTQVSITFDEAVGLHPGYLQVIDGNGRRVDAGAAFHPAGREDIITVRLRSGLGTTRAAYVASYRVISADSHPVGGVVRFTVGGATPTGAAPVTATDGLVAGLLDGIRGLSYLGLALFGGSWVLLLGRRRRRPVGRSRPVGRRRTAAADDPADPVFWWRPIVGGALLAALSLAVELVLQGPYGAGRGVGAVFDPSLLKDSLTSPFGHWHLAAVVLLAGLAVAATRARRGLSTPAMTAAALAWLVVVVAVAKGGHADVRPPVWLGLPITVLHLLAMSVWVGGLVVLAAVVLPAAIAGPGVRWAASVLPVFSRTAMVCVAALALTGTYQAVKEVGSWSALVHTTYGLLVLTKIALFVALIGLGAVARGRVAAWPDGASNVRPDGTSNVRPDGPDGFATRLRAGVLVEIIVAVVVLTVSGVLVAEPPGRNADTAGAATTTGPANGPAIGTALLSPTRSVTVEVTPGRHGAVTVAVTVSQGPAIVRVTLTATQTVQGIGPLPIPVALRDGVYQATAVNLPVAGTWQFGVSVQTSAFDIATATPSVSLR